MATINRLFMTLAGAAIFLLVPFITSGEEPRYTIPHDNAVYRGPADAPVTIIEFLDFQ